MNKFRQVPPTLAQGKPLIVKATGPLRDGIVTSIPARATKLSAAVDAEAIIWERESIRKLEGWTSLGAAAQEKILALAEHKYVLKEQVHQRLARVYRKDGTAWLELWDGTTWSLIATSEETVGDQLYSIWSTQGALVFATGLNILIYQETQNIQEGGKSFGGLGHELIVGTTIIEALDLSVQLDNLPSTSREDARVRYRLQTFGTAAWTVDIQVLVNSVLNNSTTYENIPANQDPLEQSDIVGVIPILGTLEPNDVVDLHFANPVLNSATVDRLQDNVEIASAPDPVGPFGNGRKIVKTFVSKPVDALYTFNLACFNGDADISLWIETAESGWTQRGAVELGVTPAGRTVTRTVPLNESVLAFGIVAEGAVGVPVADADIYFTVEWDEGVHAELYQASLGDDVLFSWLVDTTLALELISPDAPAASFILPFADRLLAFRDDGNPQKLSWSSDGDIRDWEIGGAGDAGSTSLLDSRSDPIDTLMGGAVIGQDIAAIFRRRSIMRGFETGNILLAIGVVHWIDNLGTEAPHSIQGVRGGAIFLGHDNMVYFLSQQGPRPIGHNIAETLEATIGDPAIVDSVYDQIKEHYMLAVPGDGDTTATTVWIFDVGAFLDLDTPRWSKVTMAVGRMAFISPGNFTSAENQPAGSIVIFSDAAEVVQQFVEGQADRNGTGYKAEWITPPIVSENPFKRYTLRKVQLAYTAPEGMELLIQGSTDGGRVWKDIKIHQAKATDIASTVTLTNFSLTGADIRLKLILNENTPTSAILHEARFHFAEQGDQHDLIG